MTASARVYAGAGRGPLSMTHPGPLEASCPISRTVTPVRMVAPEASATAPGSAPRPPEIPANTGWDDVCPGSGSRPRTASSMVVGSCKAVCRPGIVACRESWSTWPAYTPDSRGSTSRSTTVSPARARSAAPTVASPANAGPRVLMRSRTTAISDSLNRPASPSAVRSPGTPMNVRPGSGYRAWLCSSRAVAGRGVTNRGPRPTAVARSTPSVRRASIASAPRSTGTPASSPTSRCPPTCCRASSTVTRPARPSSLSSHHAAASPLIPPPTTTTCAGSGSRGGSASVSTLLHDPYDVGQRLRVCIGQHPVPQVEDMAGRGPAGCEDLLCGAGENCLAGAQKRRVEVALQRHSRCSSGGHIQRHAPVHAEDLGACGCQEIQELTGVDAEVDTRHVGRSGTNTLEHGARVWQHVTLVVGTGEETGPGVEQLYRTGARADLHQEELGGDRRQSIQQRVPQPRFTVHERLGHLMVLGQIGRAH